MGFNSGFKGLSPSAKRTSPFKSAGASVQSTTGRRAVHISLPGLYCSSKPVFCSHVTLTGYQLHSPVSPSLLLPCVTVCHHISDAVYLAWFLTKENLQTNATVNVTMSVGLPVRPSVWNPVIQPTKYTAIEMRHIQIQATSLLHDRLP